jgi:hypothetical protein
MWSEHVTKVVSERRLPEEDQKIARDWNFEKSKHNVEERKTIKKR